MKAAIALLLNSALLIPAVAQSQEYVLETGFEPCAPPSPVTLSSWPQVFQSAFPSHPGGRVQLMLPSGATNAIQFVASSSTSSFGSILTTGFPGDGNGSAQMSISPFPGCFDPALVPPGCRSEGRYPQLSWALGTSQFSCPLTPGQTYYLNISFGTSAQPPGPYCVGSCGFDLNSVIQ